MKNIPAEVWAVWGFLTLGLIAFSQVGFTDVNEGFELLAGRLVATGRRPYVDFFYQHTPFYCYVNTAWMIIFGETWRSAHLLSAIVTSCTAIAISRFVLISLPDHQSTALICISSAIFYAFDVLTLKFGTIAEAYSVCMLLSVIGFQLAIKAVIGLDPIPAVFSGLLAGLAATASLLTSRFSQF